MKNTIILTFVTAIMLIAGSALGQTRSDRRQKAQQVRIAEGRSTGEITRGESVLLRKQQRHIRRSERRAKADGELSPREKAKLERKQDRASRTIRRAKNNAIDNN